MCDTQTVANARSIHEQEWAGLLARIAVGDPSALAEFYDASSAKVFGLAMKILGDRVAAEEAKPWMCTPRSGAASRPMTRSGGRRAVGS